MGSQDADVIVVGAGISGIGAARFYLDVHPECRLIILEKESCPGGVWGAARSYPGFWSQTGLKMTQFSDRDMHVPKDARLIHNLPEAKLVTQYLEEYCDNHVYADRTLRDRMVFGCEVQSIRKDEGVWTIKGSDVTGGEKLFRAPKLIMASGLYTVPNMPDLPSSEAFEGKIIHQAHFGRSGVLSDSNVKHVVVMGAAKSAGDMAYASVKAGKSVSWIIREGGNGAGSFTEAKGLAWYQNTPEIASTRFTSLLSPSIFAPQTFFTRLCHGTAWGRQLMAKIFTTTDRNVLEMGNFDKRANARAGFQKLKSSPDFFWLNGFIGMAQQPDFWQTIAENVDVYRSDVERLKAKSVELKDDSSVPADVILCGTGSKVCFTLFERPDAAMLGLPHIPTGEEKELADWSQLEKEADEKIVSQFPGLANPPPRRKIETTTYRLYNLIAPLADDSIVFLGYVGILNAFLAAECQAIWATAYLDRKIELPSLEDRIKDVAYLNAFSKRRYPFLGQAGNQVNYDMVGYCDRLLKQCGISSHTEVSWWQYWFGVCNAPSMSGVRDEYIKKYGQ